MLPFKFKKNLPLSILCLGAHCDDIEIGAGGTLLKVFKEYKIETVSWVVFASNETRKPEAMHSAEQFLADIPDKKISIYAFRDGYLPYQAPEIKDLFESLKAEITPDLIFTHYREDRHQDHRLISDLAWNTWRNNFILEYEIPKYDGDLGVPNFYVPLDETYVLKRNGILREAFVSQRSKHWFDDATFTALLRLRGIESATIFAEAFYARKIIL